MTGKIKRLMFNTEPKVMWALEIIARKQRCSLAFLVRVAIESVLKGDPTLRMIMDEIYSGNELIKLKNLQRHFPELLTIQEQEKLKES